MPTAERVEALEAALLSLARLEFGDHHGHKFHGNQYKDDEGEQDKAERRIKNIVRADNWKKDLEKSTRLFQTIFNPNKEQRKMMKNAAFARVEALELAILALGSQEFGEGPGHPFRGNQWGPHGEGTSLKASSDVRGHLEHVMKGGKKLGQIQRLHEFLEDIPGNGRGFEAHPVVGVKKEVDTRDEAVRHILEETRSIHSPESVGVAASG